MVKEYFKAKKRRAISKKKRKLFKLIKKELTLEKKKSFNIAEVITIMIMTLIIGGVLGFIITYTSNRFIKPETTVAIPEELEDLVSTYYELMDAYYEDIDSEELLNAGIKGMMDYLGDPYSSFLDTETTRAFNEQVEGKYVGIGTEIGYNEAGKVIVTNPFSDSPAAKAELKYGDIILEVNKTSTEGLTISEVASLIKGEANTTVTIKFQRGTTTFTKDIVRSEIEISSVVSTTYTKNNKKVGYIGISIFASNTYKQFEEELLKLESENIDSLIIDVRDNSGGYLSSVTDIASLFLNKSDIIYQLQTKEVKTPVTDETAVKRTYDVAVLINGSSASASEILAGALMETYKADIIGVNSYGKGTVQRTQQLTSGATIKYTIQKWLTPNGNWINEKGITPTIEVELSDTYSSNPTAENDNQLQKAIEVLSSEDSE